MEGSRQQLLLRAASELAVPLTEAQLHLFDQYAREILVWNAKINLLSRNSQEDTLLKNMIDSLAVARFFPPGNCEVLDLGTGAGFPGVPLKIARKELGVSLLDSSRKKTSFLKQVVRTLALTDVNVLHDRVENLILQERYREKFDIIVSQAAFKLPDLIMYASPLLAREGMLVAMKSVHVEAEQAEGELVAAANGFVLDSSHDLALPLAGGRRLILIYKRNNRV